MNPEKFAEQLMNARKEQGFTQEELALRMGVTSQAVSKWERGQSLPDISLLCGICEVLSINPNTLLNVTKNTDYSEHKKESEHQQVFSHLYAEPLMILIGEKLIPIFTDGLKSTKIVDERIKIASELGLFIPAIRILDVPYLQENEYCIVVYDRVLYQETLTSTPLTTFNTIIETLFQLCKENYSTLLNNQMVKIMIDNVKDSFPALVDGIIPNIISYAFIKKILCRLLEHEFCIHNLIQILEIIEDEVLENHNRNIEEIATSIRNQLRISNSLQLLQNERRI